MVRGVFFDLDDTLVTYRAAQRAAIVAAWDRARTPRPPVRVGELVAAAERAYQERYGYGSPGFADLAHLPSREIAQRVAAAVLDQLGIPDPRTARRLADRWLDEERRALRASPGAAGALEALRGAGLKLGVITNGPSTTQREKLAHLALASFFEVVVVDTECGYPKPDHRIFDHAAAAAGLVPLELVFVGDSLELDVAGALGAGWTAVWYNPRARSLPPDIAPPHHTIRALADLLSLPGVGGATS
jgi:putative hydrolase of the HAD superfamily